MKLVRLLVVLGSLGATLAFVSCGSSSPCQLECKNGTVCDPFTGMCSAQRSAINNGTAGGAGGGTVGGGGGGGSGDGLPCQIQSVLQNSCQSCHSNPPVGGAPIPLVTRADLLATSSMNPNQTVGQRCVARMQMTASPMPPAGATPVSGPDIAAFQQWVNQGMPAGSCAGGGAGGGTGGGAGGGTGGGVGGGAGGGTGGGVGGGTGGGVGGGAGGGFGGGAGGGTGGGAGGGDGSSSSNYCKTCSTDSDCGSSTSGNFCLDDGNGGGYCGTKCTSNSSCPSGASCVQITDSTGAVLGNNCAPNSGVCGGAGGGSGGGSGGGTGGGSGGGSGGGAGGGGGSSSCTDTWSSYAKGFFSNNCSSCHSTEFSSYSSVSGNASTIKYKISSGSMPPNGLSSTTKTRILNWFNCGMPQ